MAKKSSRRITTILRWRLKGNIVLKNPKSAQTRLPGFVQKYAKLANTLNRYW